MDLLVQNAELEALQVWEVGVGAQDARAFVNQHNTTIPT